nr:potassium channel protein [Clostridia bacterium]
MDNYNDAVFNVQEHPFENDNNLKDGSYIEEQYDELPCSICSDIADFLRLTDAMVYEINELRAEVVRWRQVLIKYLSPRWAEGLRQDILSNLYLNDYEDYDAYNFYVERYHRGENPMDNKKLSKRMRRLIEGKDKTSITYLE